jgi:CAP-associated N-terminal
MCPLSEFKIMILRIFFALLCLSFLLPVTTVYAQSVTIDNSEYRKKVLKYLASDFFITEGLGLQRVYIGQSLEQLTGALGQPLKKKKQGTFSGLVIYSYQLDKQTALQVGIKKGKVQAIALAGSISSQYTTVKGARFGMPVHEIINYYGVKPYKNNQLLYRSQGIRFDFKNNKLFIIRIFPKQ